jgi:PAT family beta-lactamase induction signal transducer AmpG
MQAMAPPMTATPETAPARLRLADSLAVYLQPRVLIVLFLGFSAGLPLALSGSTLLVWMREAGVDLGTIGLFALVGTPYTIKFLWAPVVDALDVPVLSTLLGRRRGWLIFSQLLLIAAIVLLALSDPLTRPWLVAVGALLVATTSATQDIVIDAFRIETLPESEQAAGMASYVAAYRLGMLASTAGALFLVSGFEALGLEKSAAWSAGYLAMAGLVVTGIATTLIATEPARSAAAAAEHARHARENPLRRVAIAAYASFAEFLSREMALVALAFVVLYKLTDALAGAMTAPFVIDLGFSRNEYAAIIKGVGLAATLIGGFAGGFVARAYSLPASLWIGGVLQAIANLAFSAQAVIGHNIVFLTLAIVTENFTSAIGTVIFVAYLSALCNNPLHTATQYALLTALAAVGRTYLSAGAGFLAAAIGWAWFFASCAAAAVPSLLLLAWLQRHKHFQQIETACALQRLPVESTHIGAAGAHPPLEGEGREATERKRSVASGVG